MKKLITCLLALNAFACTYSQELPKQPLTLTIAYFGEMITNPGLKIGLEVGWKSWDTTTERKDGSQKSYSTNLNPGLGLGFYYHKDYQTGIFIVPELGITRQNQRGGYWGGGFGFGYLLALTPNTYQVENEKVSKTSAGHGYFITDIFLTFGKDRRQSAGSPLGYYFKPHTILGIPNFPNNVGYFALEAGIKYYLD